MPPKFYITTTLPYVNSAPHIGFAMEIVRADIFARWRRLLGDEVFFNTGTDEHGQKIYQKAVAEGKTPQAYVDDWAEKFKNLKDLLNLLPDLNFIRTTDQRHLRAAQEFWRRCQNNGDIYKKFYKIKYCVGCELEKQDSELENGRCPFHPNLDLQITEEENYFFRFSKYQKALLDLYDKNPNFVLPQSRLNEIRTFVSSGLNDFSISRLASKMPWGIPVPDDPDHVMYVWFDALVNYLTAVGWPDDEEQFRRWWLESGGPVQYCGKDNLRQQAAMWQAMLMSADLPLSKAVIVEGFITSEGQKMSKSLGNVISPLEVVKEYGIDAFRYYVAREFSNFEDSDFTWDKFRETYNANLANGLGNLTARIMKMSQNYFVEPIATEDTFASVISLVGNISSVWEQYNDALTAYDLNRAANVLWREIGEMDREIQEREPFKLFKKEPEAARKIVRTLIFRLARLSVMLSPFLPATAAKIKQSILLNQMPESLFVRK
ncbi:MAG: methionine--tRNA ligase [Candidatus Paceibacterota bacterium]|jgi:methionyl-tRNA synthetase